MPTRALIAAAFLGLLLVGCERKPEISVSGTPPPPPQNAPESRDTGPTLPDSLLSPSSGEGGTPPHGHTPAQDLPPGHPPVGDDDSSERPIDTHGPPSGGSRPMGAGPQAPPDPATLDGNEIPLRREGIGSAVELARVAPGLDDAPALRSAFERAFRLEFSPTSPAGAAAEADGLLRQLIQQRPDFAGSWRVLGKLLLDQGRMDESLDAYRIAVRCDDSYGEAHYAIAFFLGASGETEEGRQHFDRAMALGVRDERGLGPRYFQGGSTGR